MSNKAPSDTTKNNGCFSYACGKNEDGAKIGQGSKNARNNLNVHYYATVADMMSEITELPSIPEIPEKPAELGEDATDDEKAAYNDALAAYNAVMLSKGGQLERAYTYLAENSNGFSDDLWELTEDGLKFKTQTQSETEPETND